jgi:hypothetical protein
MALDAERRGEEDERSLRQLRSATLSRVYD